MQCWVLSTSAPQTFVSPLTHLATEPFGRQASRDKNTNASWQVHRLITIAGQPTSFHWNNTHMHCRPCLWAQASRLLCYWSSNLLFDWHSFRHWRGCHRLHVWWHAGVSDTAQKHWRPDCITPQGPLCRCGQQVSDTRYGGCHASEETPNSCLARLILWNRLSRTSHSRRSGFLFLMQNPSM